MATTESPSDNPPTPSRVNQETLTKAVGALLKWKDNKSKTENPQLLPQDDFVYLVLTLKKIPPKGRTNPYKIPLPNPLHSTDSELCLIIDDRSKSNLTKEDAQKKLKSDNIGVSKLLRLTKLKTDYRPFEAKRKLCDSYDLFLADNRVIPMLPKMLGKHFYKKKKIPVPVDLRHKNWKEQVEKACGSALMYLRTGTCSVLKVARGSMEKEEIVSNVAAAVDGAVEIVPKKWANVRSLHLKFAESVALPVYEALPDVKLKIDGAEMEEEKKKEALSKASKKESKAGKNDEKVSKKVSKKGRIREVRYMDNKVDDKMDDGELGSDDDVVVSDDEMSEHEEMVVAETEGKKRKKGDSKKPEVLSESIGKKRSKKVPNAGKGESEKRKKDGFSVKGIEESDEKTKKVANVGKGDGAKRKKDGLSVRGIKESDEKTKKVVNVGKRDGAKGKIDGLSVKGIEESDEKTKKVANVGKRDGAKGKNDGLSAKGIEESDEKMKKVANVRRGVSAKRKNDGLSVKGIEESDEKTKKVKKVPEKLKTAEMKVGKKKKEFAAK